MNKDIIDSPEKVNLMMDELFQLQKTGKYVFRGISNRTELLPSLFRAYEDNEEIKAKIGLFKYEIWLLEEYGKYSAQYLPNFITPLDWVASAQHYGLPTRLIDWTFNPFCALYFSLFYENLKNEGDYELLIVNLDDHCYFDDVPIFKRDSTNKYDSNNELIGSFTNFVDALSGLNYEFEKLFGYNTRKTRFVNTINKMVDDEIDKQKHKLFFCSIYKSNPRIIAQNGLFQIPRTINKKENGEYYNSDFIIDGCEKIIIIDKSQRNEIIKILKRLNIMTPTLFPDLQNICEYIKREIPE